MDGGKLHESIEYFDMMSLSCLNAWTGGSTCGK
eukprot:UN08756